MAFTAEELRAIAEADREIDAEMAAEERQRRQASKEARTKWQRAYYQSNRDALLERQKHYYKANKGKIQGKQRQYYQINKEKLRGYQRQYCIANREKIAKRQREYRKRKKLEREEKHEREIGFGFVVGGERAQCAAAVAY